MFESELLYRVMHATGINGRKQQYFYTLSVTDEGDEIKGHRLHAALKAKSN